MARRSTLVHLPNVSHHAEDGGDRVELSECPDGIPVGWVLLFGGRNYWEPDETVADRGGAAGERSRFETPVEVAEARLTNAMTTLRAAEHLWVWFAALEILRLQIKTRGKGGVLRLEAPWALDGEERRNKTLRTTAYAENYVNMVGVGQIENVPQYVAPLDKICPFVPYCRPDDAKRARKAGGIFGNLDEAAQAAALIVGAPSADLDKFRRRVASVFEPEYAKLPSLPPYPEVKERLSYSSAVVPKNAIPGPEEADPEKPKGLIARLKRMVGR